MLLIFLLRAGLLIYGCYGVWHSTLELEALQQQAEASSYQRFDEQLDDTFFYSEEEQHGREEEEGPYQGWSAPDERGSSYTLQEQQHEGGHRGYQSSSGGRTNHGFHVSDEEG